MVTNTGKERATTITVVKSVGGAQVYSHSYSFLAAFGTYSAITSTECAELSIANYTARLAAFKAYVESVEIGLTVDTTAAYRDNLNACPIN
jgi:hypothetical protein